MQRKGSNTMVRRQGENLVTVGIDMGGSLWATAIHDWSTGRDRYYPYKDKGEAPKEEQLWEKLRELVTQGRQVEVFYEAGRYGYWPARKMINLGAQVHILPINKLVVIMSGKKIKTDKLDAKFLSEIHPEDKLPKVSIPSEDGEGCRDAIRELERLTKESGRLNAQMIAILERTSLRTPKGYAASSEWRKLLTELKKQGLLIALPRIMALRLANMTEELELVEEHEKRWLKMISEKEKEDLKSAVPEAHERGITKSKLESFRGIGEVMSRQLAWEVGTFTRFASGKKFAAYFGMTPSPYCSGTMNREQGISKQGRRNLRRMVIEMAWMWTFWQPQSWMVKKWQERLKIKGRSRRTAIVALARQLLVALWRFVVKNEPIEGADFNRPFNAVTT